MIKACKLPKDCEKVYEDIYGNQDIVFIRDILAYYDTYSFTFYKRFPKDSPEYARINEALEHNKTLLKKEIRKKLLNMNNPTSLIFLYKILTTDPVERMALDGRYEEYMKTQEKDKDETIELNVG